MNLYNRLGFRIFLSLVVIVLTQETLAFAVEPHEIVDEVIQRVMAKVSDIDARNNNEMDEVLKVFEREISPHLDFIAITRWLAGERWSNFGNDEKKKLESVVRDYIVRAYSSLLGRGRSVVIKVEPTSTIKTRSARVGAKLATQEGGEIDVEFRLIRSANSWKLYDLTIEGFSFVRSLRAELGPVLNNGGVTGLRDYLNSHR